MRSGHHAARRVAAPDAGVERLEHLEVGARREVRVAGRALRVEVAPQIGLVPALEVAHPPGEVSGEELAESAEVVHGVVADEPGGAGEAAV